MDEYEARLSGTYHAELDALIKQFGPTAQIVNTGAVAWQ